MLVLLVCSVVYHRRNSKSRGQHNLDLRSMRTRVVGTEVI